jgi:hypothetical protein
MGNATSYPTQNHLTKQEILHTGQGIFFLFFCGMGSVFLLVYITYKLYELGLVGCIRRKLSNLFAWPRAQLAKLRSQRSRPQRDIEIQPEGEEIELTNYAAPTPRPSSPSPSYHSQGVAAHPDPFLNRGTFMAMQNQKGSSNEASFSGTNREVPNPYTNLNFSRAVEESEGLPSYSSAAAGPSGAEIAYPEIAYINRRALG